MNGHFVWAGNADANSNRLAKPDYDGNGNGDR